MGLQTHQEIGNLPGVFRMVVRRYGNARRRPAGLGRRRPGGPGRPDGRAGQGRGRNRIQREAVHRRGNHPGDGRRESDQDGQKDRRGGLYWQYLEDISKITPHEQNPLRLKKSVFLRKPTESGPVIEPIRGPVAVGDTLIIGIELRTDRDMEYVPMKDHRGSGLEPVDVLSGYRFQDGLAYDEATKDTAAHFFIDCLPQGTFGFEYALRVARRGSYQNGMAPIECLDAPEFNSHSDGIRLEVH